MVDGLANDQITTDQRISVQEAIGAKTDGFVDRGLAMADELSTGNRLGLRKQGEVAGIAADEVTDAKAVLHAACTVLGLATLASLALCFPTGGLGCVAAMPMIVVLAHGQC